MSAQGEPMGSGEAAGGRYICRSNQVKVEYCADKSDSVPMWIWKSIFDTYAMQLRPTHAMQLVPPRNENAAPCDEANEPEKAL